MKLTKTILFLSILALCSCKGTDDGEDTKPESIVMNQISAASLSATVSCTFSDLSDNDIMYGRFVVLYSSADNVEEQFNSWRNGNDNPACQVNRKGSVKHGTDFAATLSGLQPDTKYNCCIGFASEDGSRRETSGTMTFVTLPFKPDITTGAAASIRYFDAILNGSVTFASDGDAEICSTGLLVSAKQNATVSEGTLLPVIQGDKLQFALTAAKLNPDTQYYYRAYASHKDADGKDSYTFGQEKSFTTKSFDEMAVDLGLSVKWANCDLGDQEYTDEYRLGFCWGLTYSIDGRQHGRSIDPEKDYGLFESYNSYNDFVYKDLGRCISGTGYDAAKAMLGGKWRMPTKEEAMELIEKCSTKINKTIGEYGGVSYDSCTFTGSNGNSIQFNLQNMYWWTGSSNDDNTASYVIGLSENDPDLMDVFTFDWGKRYLEFAIRPVCDY